MSNIFNCHNENHQNPLQLFTQFMDTTTMDNEDLVTTNWETEIDGHVYYKNVIMEEVDIIVRIIRKHWCFMQNAVLNDMLISFNDLTQRRDIINKCLKLIILSLKECESERLKRQYSTSTDMEMETLLPLILPTYELEKEVYQKLTSSACGRQKCPTYQYFHTYQEVHCYLLLFKYISGKYEELEHQIEFILKDMVLLAEKAFQQNSKSPFTCSCNQKFWLIIQVLSEKALGDDSFWLIFNKVVQNFKSEYILWLLANVANLQGFDLMDKFIGAQSNRIKPNYVLLEALLKNIVSTAEFHSSILPTLKAMQPLLCDLWLKWPKIEIYQLLWEYFSKRLNVAVRNSTSHSLVELTDLIDTILWTPKDCQQEFELFLSMLCLHLNEYPHHWGKMKGRIYSQLGPNKVKDLNNGGIFNVLLLFVCLTKVNFEELSKKFILFIENLPVEKKQNQLIWSFYSAFVVRHLRENRDIEASIPPFIKMLEEASTEHKSFHLIKTFIKDFEHIMTATTNLQLHQWLLINSWIHKYMTSCYYPDLVTLLKVLLNTLEQINREQVWCEWESPFRNYVYPALKYSRNTPEISGTLAAKIALLFPSLLPEAFSFFNSETVNPKVAASFLCVVLDCYPNSFVMSVQQENVALQSWAKFCFLTRDGYEDLTRKVIKMDIIPQFLKSVMGSAKDPLVTFVDHVGSNVKEHRQSAVITRLCDAIFGQAERWISQYFNQPENEAIVLRVYTCLGLAFFKIGPLLYDKYKANCPFARLVTCLLLPTELMVGKPLNAYILQAIKKTWHLFFEASVKLNTSNDAFIDRILREMVVRYMPHFATVDSPMLKCLDNEVTADILLDKMANGFFKQSTKEPESTVFKSLKLTNDFVLSTTSIVLLKLVVNKTLYGLFEIIMFHSQRNMAVSVVTSITSSPLYPHVKSDFEGIIVVITEKHISFNTLNYFQLLGCLAKLIPSGLRILIPQIKQHVANVERMRGVGYDKTLRLNMERFEANLSKLP